MKRVRPVRLTIASVVALAIWLVSAAAAQADGVLNRLGYDTPLCQSRTSLCIDPAFNPPTGYVGHDEPSVLFKSHVPGSGNDVTYTITLPKDPRIQPTESGANGTTWNFELRSTYWFGMTMCDTESAPNFTKTCTPDSDRNDLEGTNPKASNYIGKHPGNAYMELQFYEPGYVPQFEGFGCTGTQYCAAMTIDSFSSNQNTGVDNTAACNEYILGGVEPINWAYVTRNGKSQAPANPLFTGTFDNPNLSAVTPDTSKDLLMNPGDRVRIHMYDTPAGFRVDMFDLSTGQHGSMTASVANGFAHILYQPNSSTCTATPYAFHPEYSTGTPRGNTWSAHTYNIAGSDEIGHFENCQAVDANFNCTSPGSQDAGGLDQDDGNNFCVPGTDSLLVHIDGCFFDDGDFDGQSYRSDWPGSNPNPFVDRQLHTTPMAFTSATTNDGRTDYSAIAFEADLPRIEADDSQFNPPFCDRTTGANCVNPPAGAQFYPLYTTGRQNGGCIWQQGATHIPGTTNTFGGSSTTEYGPLLLTAYPTADAQGNPVIERLYDNFNSGDIRNPCPVFQFGGRH
ncbi:MAG: hypothetical protein ACXVSL_13970 [Solirubrobacteraceae bacterium]